MFKTFLEGQSFLDEYSKTIFDLIFLDIEMPELNGIQLAQKLYDEKYRGKVIFVSNREDLVFESLRTQPFGFVRKSKFTSDIHSCLKNYFEWAERDKKNFYIIKQIGGQKSVPIEDIMYIKTEGRGVVFYLSTGEELSPSNREGIQTILERLSPEGFLECCKGIIVNHKYIKSIENKDIFLTDGTSLPLSRRQSVPFKEKYLEWIGKKTLNIY